MNKSSLLQNQFNQNIILPSQRNYIMQSTSDYNPFIHHQSSAHTSFSITLPNNIQNNPNNQLIYVQKVHLNSENIKKDNNQAGRI